MSVPRGIIRIFNTEESKDLAFKEDADILTANQMEYCTINHTRNIISMKGQHYAYRSPKMGNTVLQMPVDKIELVEQVDDIHFIAVAMQAMESTKVARALGNEKPLSNLTKQ